VAVIEMELSTGCEYNSGFSCFLATMPLTLVWVPLLPSPSVPVMVISPVDKTPFIADGKRL